MSNYGLFVKGKMLGARQRNKVNGQGYYNEIGIGLEIPDGFGGTKQDQIIIRVSQALVNAGLMNRGECFHWEISSNSCLCPCVVNGG